MKSFKDIWLQALEDTTTMSVDLTPSKPLKRKKEKVERRYDGRTKEGKKFVERIMAKRQARESNKVEK